MGISVEHIQKLREATSCGVIECKKALEEAGGDFNKAKDVLRQRGIELAQKKQTRTAKEGRVESYVHMGSKIATLVEVNCETDFVAKNEDFCQFTKDLALHITATSPKYIKKEEVPSEALKDTGKPEDFYKTYCLLEQGFVKDPSLSIKDYLNSLISKTGENIVISRFIRYKVGEVD